MTKVDIPLTPTAPKSPYEDAKMAELEELRQRGLAKSLTKHFTQSIQEVEAELAAADAALQELEARKARASEFTPSSNEITQLDQMYMKVFDWKKQCRKREQETVMLYRRYVEKFGNSIKLATPEELMSPKKKTKSTPIITSPLATADVAELAKVFDEAARENGIPDFLRPSEAFAPSPFNEKALEEILEEESLQDPDTVAPCKSFGVPPTDAPCKSFGVSQTDTTDSDCDDSSIVSGLTTLNSQVTREVLKEVETKVFDFIKNETENIRKLLEEEDANSKAAHSVTSRASTLVGTIADQSASNAENMVLAMQKILEEFKQEEAKSEQSLRSTMVRRVDAGSEGEEWYEHWDPVYQRTFYVETKTNITQWHMPPSMTDISSYASSSVCDSSAAGASAGPSLAGTTKVLDFADFKPDMRAVHSSTRIEKYRAKRRQQRNRRIAASSLVVALLGVGFMYYKHTHPEEVEKMLETASSTVVNTMDWANNAHSVAPTVVQAPKQSKKITPKKQEKTVPVPKKPKDKLDIPVVVTKEEDAVDNTKIITETTKKSKAETETLIIEAKKKTKEPIVVEEHNVEPEDSDDSMADQSDQGVGGFVRALLGPPAYKEVNHKCRERARYCGNYAP